MKKEILLYLIGVLFMLFLYSFAAKEFYFEWVPNFIEGNHLVSKSCDDGMDIPKDICEESKNYLNVYGNKKPDAFTGFYYIITGNVNLAFVFPLVICFTSIYFISKEFKGKTLYNYLQRKDYKSYMKRIFKKAYKYILYYIPVFLIVFIFCICESRNFDMSLALGGAFYTWPLDFLENALINAILYFLNYILINSILISLSLIFVRKFVNPIISSLIAYLSFLVLCVGSEILSFGIDKVFGISLHGYFNILNAAYTFDLVMWKYSLYLFCLSVIFFLITYVIYKNKEKMIISLEKYSKE